MNGTCSLEIPMKVKDDVQGDVDTVLTEIEESMMRCFDPRSPNAIQLLRILNFGHLPKKKKKNSRIR